VVVDGFETFELSQSFPFHHHLAVDAATGFFLSRRPAMRERPLESRSGVW
jgi:hypothetical protein